MNIEEIKGKQEALEKDLSDLLTKFTNETQVEVDHIFIFNKVISPEKRIPIQYKVVVIIDV